MLTPGSQELSESLREAVGDRLRRVVIYDADSYRVVYERPDIGADGVADDRRALDARLESLSAAFHDSLAPDGFGDLACMVKCFERGVELNFALREAEGVLVTVDAGALPEAHGLIETLRGEIVDAVGAPATAGE